MSGNTVAPTCSAIGHGSRLQRRGLPRLAARGLTGELLLPEWRGRPAGLHRRAGPGRMHHRVSQELSGRHRADALPRWGFAGADRGHLRLSSPHVDSNAKFSKLSNLVEMIQDQCRSNAKGIVYLNSDCYRRIFLLIMEFFVLPALFSWKFFAPKFLRCALTEEWI